MPERSMEPLTRQERQRLTDICVAADLLNIAADQGLLLDILVEGCPGYRNMTDRQLLVASGELEEQ